MTTLHYVKKARKDIKGTDIKRGDPYYWWQFAFSQKQVSKERPRRSRYMTRSPYLAGIYDVEDAINALKADDITSDDCLSDIIADIESIKDEAESSLDNIPEQLKDAPAGSTLQEYIDNLESWIDELERVDFDNVEDDSFVEEAAAEWDALSADEKKRIRRDWDPIKGSNVKYGWIEERAKELLDERREEVLNEIQNVSYPG